MKKIMIAMLAIVGVLFATSCSDEEGDTMLTLSESTVEFDSKAGEKTIAVSSDAEWEAVGTDWIATKKEGNNLIINVFPNRTVYPREDAVKVKAGNTVVFLKVTQKGLAGVIEAKPVIIPDTKGQYVLEVGANDWFWTVETDVEWLVLTPKQRKSELVISFDENETEADRVATLNFTIGGIEQQVEVKQLGRMVFLLPYGDLGNATPEKVKEFERLRINKLIAEHDGGETGLVLSYDTRSTKVCPMLEYFFTEDGKLTQCIMTPVDRYFLPKLEDFGNYLETNGFELEYESGQGYESGYVGYYTNAEMSASAKLIIAPAYVGYNISLIWKPLPKQDKEYPTFKKFPYPLDFGTKEDKIVDYEAKNGGTLNETYTRRMANEDQLFYEVSKKDEAQTSFRMYLVSHDDQPNPGLSMMFKYMENTSLAFYNYNGEYHLTNEFKELCKKEGFESAGVNGGFFTFQNEAKDMVMLIRYVPQLRMSPVPVIELRFGLISENSSFQMLNLK